MRDSIDKRDGGLDRRSVLVLACGAMCSHALGCGGGSESAMPSAPSDVAAGPASAIVVGTLRALPDAPVAVGRDQGGIYAFSLICTHAGCDIRAGVVSASEIKCPCHGSRYDIHGNVVAPPATRPLPHLSVTADVQGNLTVHRDQTVDPSTRLSI
jgi:Rieske Fe-S protein